MMGVPFTAPQGTGSGGWGKGTPQGADQQRWFDLPTSPDTHVVVVCPGVVSGSWARLRGWFEDHRAHFGGAELWLLHAPKQRDVTRGWVHTLL